MSSFIAGTNTSVSTAADRFLGLGVSGNSNISDATEANITSSITVATTLSNLYIQLATAPGVGKSYAFTIMKNGSATGLTVTISGTNTTNTDAVNTVSFAAGDTVSLKTSPTGTPTASGTIWYNLQSSATSQLIFGRNTTASAVTANYPIMGYGTSTTESRIQAVMPCAGTLSNLYAVVNNAPAGVTAKVFTLRVNGANSALTTTITGVATSNSDTTHSVSVAAGDLVNIQVTVTGAPASSFERHSIAFTPTNADDSVLLSGNNDDPSNSLTQYNLPASFDPAWTATETAVQHIIGAYTLKNFYARTNVASGAAKDYTFTVRNNAASTALVVACVNTTAVQSTTTDVTVAQGDKLSLMSVPTGTPTVSRINTGILLRPSTSSQTINATALASTATIGTPSVTPGSVSLSPTGLASTSALGTPTISSLYNLGVTAVASTLSIGSPTLTPGSVNISPSGIPSTASTGSPTVTAGSVTISPNGIASTASIGNPTITSVISISVSGIAGTSALGTPTLSPGSVSISPTGISSTAVLGTPSLSSIYTIGVTAVESTVSIGVPSLTPGDVTLSPSSLSSTTAIGTPIISSTYTISPLGVALTTQFGTPDVTVGDAEIAPASITSTVVFGDPSIVNLEGQLINPNGINTTVIGNPTVQPGSVALTPEGLVSSLAIGSVALSSENILSVTGIGSEVILGMPSVVSISTGRLKVWFEGTWRVTEPKVWDGSTFKESTPVYWDGDSWA